MTDRTPKYPGRVRLKAVTGDPELFDMVMEDEPTDEGTPPTKGNLLADDTSELIFRDSISRTVNQSLRRLSPAAHAIRFVATYTVAGTYQWICPANGDYIALVMGGGGSGAIAVSEDVVASGGAAGFIEIYKNYIAKGVVKNLVVGAGGPAIISVSQLTNTAQDGYAGEASSFDGVSAQGGNGGRANRSSIALAGAAGSQYSTVPSSASFGDITNFATLSPPRGGIPVLKYSSSGVEGLYTGRFFPTALFVDENGLPVTQICAGGSAYGTSSQASSSGAYEGYSPLLANGKRPSAAVWSGTNGARITADAPTDPGAGGGAAIISNYGETGYPSSAPGADGVIAIYRLGGQL